jgi:hypothetical protein
VTNPIHPDLLACYELAYKPSGLLYKNLVIEAKSQEYGACEFHLNNRHIKFRVAKITPTKVGQFVTFWKRSFSGPIVPYDISDIFDFLVVSVRDEEHFGQFVFPKSVLHEKGLLSQQAKGGKRAMRVYPPWDITESPQAKKTQKWQCDYFFEINDKQTVDVAKVCKLFNR